MKDAEAEVTDAYGMFVHTDHHHHHDDQDQELFDDHLVRRDLGDVGTTNTRAEAQAQTQAENGGSAGESRTVAV